MKNWKFHRELRQCVDPRGGRMTVSRLARALRINRSRLCDTLNNKPGHGGQTRLKVVRYLQTKFPERLPALLEVLRWDPQGNVISGNVPPVTMFPVERKA